MNIQDQKEAIKGQITKGEFEKAIDQLISTTQYEDQQAYQDVVFLKTRYHKLKSDDRKGLMSNEEKQVELNKIRAALMDITQNLSIGQDKLQISEIRNLIANGDLKASLEKLRRFYGTTYPNDDLQLNNDIIAILARQKRIDKDTINGLISMEDSNRQNNKLTLETLGLLDEIEKRKGDLENQQSQRQQKVAKPKESISDILSKKYIDLYADIDQVKPVFGDVFNAKFDLIVIPKHEAGDITASMEDGMKRMGYVHQNKPAKSGTIELLPESESSKIPGRVCYAISVKSGRTSSLPIIEQLGMELGKLSLGPSGFKNITTPLLGTGAGGLDKISVFNTLEKGFKSTCDKDANLSIHFLEKEIFDQVAKARREKLFKVITQSRSRFDADSVFGEDRLGISHEVESFANLIVSTDLEPPLSIGLFGNWGTGKSFFMEKLSEKVDELNQGENNGTNSMAICKSIVQIKFNAWYYIDANLWASLVSNIFDKLSEHVGIKTQEEKKENQLFEQLASTKEQVQLAQMEIDKFQAEIDTLDDDLQKLKKERKENRENLENVKLKHYLKEVQKDPEVKNFINDAKAKLGFSELEEVGLEAGRSVEEIEGLIKRYQSTQGRVIHLYKSLVSLKNWKLILLFLVIIALPFIVRYLFGLLDDFDNKKLLEIIGQLGSFVAALAVFIRWIINKADPILQGVNKGVEYLSKAKSRLQNLQDVASAGTDDQIAALEHEYAQLNVEHQKAIAQRRSAEKSKTMVEKEIEEIKKGKRLKSFIQKRIQASDYQKHLGLISIVRQDFDRLSHYLQMNRSSEAVKKTFEQIEAGENIDRIILYIDDLDRCPPEKVVDVLQAIHLILAFPLFVVVVGVDVRWVSKSLLKKYGKMLSNQDGQLSDDPELRMELQGSATPYDYLEKIFQIPFKLKNINDADKKKYLAKLIEKDLADVEEEIIQESLESKITTPQNDNPDDTIAELSSPDEKKSTKNKIEEMNTQENAPEKIQTSNVKTSVLSQSVYENLQPIRVVKLTKREFDFIIGLSPIAGNSARTLKRFVNLARLVKSNKNWIPASNATNTVPYNACLFMLAVVVGSPWMFPLFFSLIKAEEKEKGRDKATTLEQLVKKKEFEIGREIDKHGHINKEWDNLRQFLADIEDHENVDIRAINAYNLEYLKKVAPIMSRFSFRALEEVEVNNFLKKLKQD